LLQASPHNLSLVDFPTLIAGSDYAYDVWEAASKYLPFAGVGNPAYAFWTVVFVIAYCPALLGFSPAEDCQKESNPQHLSVNNYERILAKPR
jgi:hypothetical protein